MVNDFSKATIKKLSKKGITILHTVLIPDTTSSMPYANGQTGYQIDNNGQGQIKTFLEVLELTK